MTIAPIPLTIEGLAEQLAKLQHTVERLERENAELRADERRDVAERHSVTHMDATPRLRERTDRRKLLSGGLKLAAGAVGAGVMLARQPESARADSPHTSTYFEATNGGWAVYAEAMTSEAVASNSSALRGSEQLATGDERIEAAQSPGRKQ